MNKKAIFIFLIIILGVCILLVYNVQKEKKQNDIIRNDMIFDEETNLVYEEETLETTSQEEKTTPNTLLVLKKYYTDCGHTISNTASMPEEMVNLTEEEIAQKYPNWEVEVFSEDEVVLAITLDSFCGEHYYLTEEDGYISVYIVDEAENKTLKATGKLSTEYLTETDKIALKNGIMVYGTEELNKILEDFET